ncbi:MAG TPA: hypothetical protein VGL92_18130 [Acidimicrobiia bacterium]|jgi:hypothetical protein
MRLLATMVMAGLLLAGCDTGNDNERTGSGTSSPTTTTVTVLSGVLERDGGREQPATEVPYGTLRGVRGELGAPRYR